MAKGNNKQLTLPIEKRATVGTTSAAALRRVGRIPAVVYGHGTDPVHVSFEAKDFDDLMHHGGRTGMLTLTLDGRKSDTALVRDVARNPVTRKVVHVDLQRVTEHEAVRATIPLVAVGTPRGVREFGGVMDVIVHEIEVEGPVDELPDRLEVDVSDLGIHQHVSASDIKLPAGFKLLEDPDMTVVSVESSKTAQNLEEVAAGTTTEQVAPEVIGATPESESQ